MPTLIHKPANPGIVEDFVAAIADTYEAAVPMPHFQTFNLPNIKLIVLCQIPIAEGELHSIQGFRASARIVLSFVRNLKNGHALVD